MHILVYGCLAAAMTALVAIHKGELIAPKFRERRIFYQNNSDFYSRIFL